MDKKTPSLFSATAKKVLLLKVLLLIDWDNLFYSLFSRFGADEMRIEHRIKRLMDWVEKEIGELLGGCGIVFAPEHLTHLHQQICARNKLKLMICPKRQLASPQRNPKTGEMETTKDTVDETIIWFVKTMVCHPNFKFLCLVTGDNDYIPLFKEMAKHDIKRALVVPTTDCLSKTKGLINLVNLVDEHPTTLRKMSFRLDNI